MRSISLNSDILQEHGHAIGELIELNFQYVSAGGY